MVGIDSILITSWEEIKLITSIIFRPLPFIDKLSSNEA